VLITSIDRTQTFVEFSSPRGSAATPWPIRWLGPPAIESIGPLPYVTYDQVMTLTGKLFADVSGVAFTYAQVSEPLAPATHSPPGPGQYFVVDENHIQVVVSSTGVAVPRGLAAGCSGTVPFAESFPGTRGFKVTNGAGTGARSTNAFNPAGPAVPTPTPPDCNPLPSSSGGAPSGGGEDPLPWPNPIPRFPPMPRLPPSGNGSGECGTNTICG
jgi:hypothetical protein